MPGAAPLSAQALLTAWEDGLGLSPTRRALALLAAAEPSASPEALAQLPIGAQASIAPPPASNVIPEPVVAPPPAPPVVASGRSTGPASERTISTGDGSAP